MFYKIESSTTPVKLIYVALFVINLCIVPSILGVESEAVKQEEDIVAPEDLFGGFEPSTKIKPEQPEKIEDDSGFLNKFEFGGWLGIGSSYNLHSHKPENTSSDWTGLSRLKTELALKLEGHFNDNWKLYVSGNGFYDWSYPINDKAKFTDDVLDNYEDEIELGETWLAGKLTDNLRIKAGRQIQVWGKSDCIRIADVLNPIDLREPGVIDIEDVRLPVSMVRLDYLWRNWNITGSFIPEIRFNKNPEFGHDFYPFAAPIPNEDKPDSEWNNAEYGIAVEGAFSGWGISLYWADIYKDMYIDIPHVEVLSISGETGMPVLASKHSRVQMFGTAANIVVGNFVLKAETAFFDGFEFMNDPHKDYDRLDLMAGVEYYGFTDTTIIFEAANRHLIDFKKQLETYPDSAIEDEFQWVLRLEKNLLNNKLKLILFTTTYGLKGEDGAFQKISAEYELTDAIKVNGGGVFYKSGDLFLFDDIGDNDRAFFEIKYWF